MTYLSPNAVHINKVTFIKLFESTYFMAKFLISPSFILTTKLIIDDYTTRHAGFTEKP